MPQGARLLVDNAFYHIMVRGNRKQKVFKESVDFEEYVKRLRRYKNLHRFRLYGFCLMPNHIHMIGEVKEKDSLAKFMHGLNRSYTAYFNERYELVGHLWQGRFKSKVITKDKYVVDCINYIELNPVRAGISTQPHTYRWSSYSERVFGEDAANGLLDTLSL